MSRVVAAPFILHRTHVRREMQHLFDRHCVGRALAAGAPVGIIIGVVSWFRPIAPSPALRDLLECRYVAVSAGHHDLLPDGCMDLVWTADLGVVLCGPDTTGWSFDMPPGREMAGLRFRPGAASGVFGIAASELVDRRVPLADLLGDRPARLLAARLADAADGAGRMAAFEELVLSRRADADPTIEMADARRRGPEHARRRAGRARRRVGASAPAAVRPHGRVRAGVPGSGGPAAALRQGAVRVARAGASPSSPRRRGTSTSRTSPRTSATIADRTPRQLVGVLAGSSLAVESAR